MDVSEEWDNLLKKIIDTEPDWKKSYEAELEMPEVDEKQKFISNLKIHVTTQEDIDYIMKTRQQRKPRKKRALPSYPPIYKQISITKTARLRGEAYRTIKTNNPKPPRELKPACKCRLSCYTRVPKEVRQELFDQFWQISDHTAKWDFIGDCVAVVPKERSRVEDSRRANTRIYSFFLKEGRVEVCKTMFLNTLGISSALVSTVCDKIAKNGFVTIDERGRHRKI